MSMADGGSATASLFGGITSKGLATGIGDLGGAVGSLFTAAGDQASQQNDYLAAENDTLAASSYTQASGIASQNLSLEQQSTAIKETQADREIFQNESSQQATAAGNGFQEAGSAAAILADSANQGALQKQLIQQQGDITANATQEQLLALNTQSQEASNQATMQTNAGNAAGSAATGALVGGAFKAVAGIASIALA